MKFSNGYWLTKEGYEVHYPRSVRDVQEVEDGLILYAPCKDIRHRGDTLNIALLTIKLSSPMENVIRVQTWHHRGVKPKTPNFEIKRDKAPFTVEENENEIYFTSGSLKVKITKDDFGMVYYNGNQKLTHTENKGLAWITGPNKDTFMRAQLNLNVGEYVYGLENVLLHLLKMDKLLIFGIVMVEQAQSKHIKIFRFT